jgi:alpha-mannosidase
MGFMACSRGAQSAWFADGYHGGIYGRNPPSFTQFIVDALRQHPDWRLNLEIEPETWDFARTNTPEAYQALKALIMDPAAPRRVEFVNPAYGPELPLEPLLRERGTAAFGTGLAS